jgi:YHS domain-containing protein
MRLLIPLILILIVFYLLRSILRGLLQGSAHSSFGATGMGPREGGHGVKVGKMEKDPVCGTFVDVATSIQATFNGKVRYFCSQACLAKYKEGH